MFWPILSLVSVISGDVMGVFIKRLNQGAGKNPLRGLYNRRCFYDRMNYEMEKMKRTKLPLLLALTDIDNFKTINDTYGHLEGDRVLPGYLKHKPGQVIPLSVGVVKNLQ